MSIRRVGRAGSVEIRAARRAHSLYARLLGSHLLVALLTAFSLLLLTVGTILWAQRDDELVFRVAFLTVRGLWPALLTFTLVTIVAAAPFVGLLAWLIGGRLARRLQMVARTSRQFAAGDFAARIGDHGMDEVGELAQQVDAMADALEQNIDGLRALAQQNAELADQAERAAREAERLRLARDLHDDIAQQLFSLSLRTAALPDAIAHQPEKARYEAREIAALAERTLLDLRALLVELRPSPVAQRGLADALRELCQHWQATGVTPVDCTMLLQGRHIAAGIKDVIYRVAQEALSNVAKHAAARSVSLALVEGRQRIVLSVTDDGQGFDMGSSVERGHYGLVSMQERARAVGGRVEVESGVGRGTTVHLVIPLPQIEDEQR